MASDGCFAVGDLKFFALGDRVLIEEDAFKSGYECPACDGTGIFACESCGGRGVYTKLGGDGPDFKCSTCDGKGTVHCHECEGKGGLLITPDVAQRRPTTGTIASVGDGCKVLKVGEKVMYSNFAGYVIDLNRAGKPVTLRILHESEVLCRMDGHLDMRTLKGKTEVATFQN